MWYLGRTNESLKAGIKPQKLFFRELEKQKKKLNMQLTKNIFLIQESKSKFRNRKIAKSKKKK